MYGAVLPMNEAAVMQDFFGGPHVNAIIACGIVAPMPTPAKAPIPATRPAVSLEVVISELQFIADLQNHSPKDPRLPQLLADAKQDLAAAAAKMSGGNDPIIEK
jgi:hypothetical protein